MGSEKRDRKEQHDSKCKKVWGPRSEKAFWQDLTATGGDVEVDEEGGRKFNECPRSMSTTWRTSERCSVTTKDYKSSDPDKRKRSETTK